MSNEVAIRIENLGKRYRYGGPAAASSNLRADLTDWAKGLWPRRSQRSAISAPPATAPHHATLHEVQEKHIAEDPNYFWALRDINLEIKQGEVVGIIGRNGAGKSTLLKILSRITPPTTGKITYSGRMASLLEVGTGFHRELTGRENIFLNGSILGMKRSEIAKKFDEIVAFAEVEKFIDTPVKFYSSGMYVRLAFAVAAHLEPEILVVDEVLAVGDAQFQKKCLGKMGEVASHGRTVLFVSHNMPAVQSLCSRGVLLDCGGIAEDGNTYQTIAVYLRKITAKGAKVARERLDREGNGDIRLTDIHLTVESDTTRQTVQCGDTVVFTLSYCVYRQVQNPTFLLSIYDADGLLLIHANTRSAKDFVVSSPRAGCVFCRIPRFPLPPGDYHINVGIMKDMTNIDRLESACLFSVVAGDFFGTGSLASSDIGKFIIDHKWTHSSGA